jgi:hypothetical protein
MYLMSYHQTNEENRTKEKTVRNEITTRLKSQRISKIKNWTQWQTDGRRTDRRTTDGRIIPNTSPSFTNS